MVAEGEAGRNTLRLTGEIEIHMAHDEAHLIGIELEKEGPMVEPDGAFHLELMGPVRELRKLGIAHPELTVALDMLGDDEERLGSLRLSADPDLVADLAETAMELGEECAPDELLSDPVWASLAFSLDRYSPESIGLAES